MTDLMQRFSNYYSELTVDSPQQLGQLYRDDIEFCDPAHCVSGLAELRNYFTATMQGVELCAFDISDIKESGDSAFVTWTMRLQHPKLNGGRLISVPGVSHVRFDQELIFYHRDYFDLGAMLYENVPVLGGLIRGIKKRMSS